MLCGTPFNCSFKPCLASAKSQRRAHDKPWNSLVPDLAGWQQACLGLEGYCDAPFKVAEMYREVDWL